MTQQTTAPSATQKPIQTLQELAQNLRSDRYYFVSPSSAGDTYRLCLIKPALEKHYKGKIIVIIKAMHEAVCEMFKGLEYEICDDKSVDLCMYEKCLLLDNVVSIPNVGKIYTHFIGYRFNITKNSLFDFDKLRLMLPLDSQIILPTNLPKLSESLQEKLAKIAPLDKIILLCPEANTSPCLPLIVFKFECEQLLRQGYKIIVNIPKHKEYLKYFSDGVYDLDLSLKDAIALGINCAGVISARSGFCDIVSPYCKKLKVYYMFFDDIIQWDSYDKLASQQIYTYDMPIYKQFLRMSRECLPIKLHKRYTTKGFFRKLRTPFTLYFKIYLRHTNTSQGTMDNQMCEFIENELAKTYEYQLGLALQRACERFWYGGFLAFPFAYAKIRAQKGKTLMRMDSIV